MKSNNKKIVITVMVVLILIVAVIGITYAVFSIGNKQDIANTFSSGCLKISLENETNAISLSNVFPITDLEGLDTTAYSFTIKNTCSTSTNYQINLESLNQVSNSLSADYIKVALSSDTNDNIVSILSSNTIATPSITNAYEAYNLYTSTIEGNASITYNLRIWLDYDATKEQAGEKTYTSKINVIANPALEVVDNLEVKFTQDGTNLTANLNSNITSLSYCISDNNFCTPNTSATITDNTTTIALETKENKQILCYKVNNTGNIKCTEGLSTKVSATDTIIAKYTDTSTELAYDGTSDNNLRYIGADPNNYVYFNCSDYANPSADTCELWRIIGVMNNMETVSNGTQNLIKLIRADFLNSTTFYWDYKKSGVGSSTTNYGSNDWSDSQLMMMLNPQNIVERSFTDTSKSYTIDTNGYVLDNNNYKFYQNVGSYYNASSTGYKPASVTAGTDFAGTSIDFSSSGLKNDTTRNIIEDVVWSLGGTASYTSSSNGLASHFYGYERGTTVYSGRPTTWKGKVGLMYPSDYGYATSGGNSTDRDTCLATEMYNWDGVSDCYTNDWLLDSEYWQWTLTPNSGDASYVFGVFNAGYVCHSNAGYDSRVRPVVYLTSNAGISSGEGTSISPYTLSV